MTYSVPAQKWSVTRISVTQIMLSDDLGDDTADTALLTENEVDEYEKVIESFRRWQSILYSRAMYHSGNSGELQASITTDH